MRRIFPALALTLLPLWMGCSAPRRSGTPGGGVGGVGGGQAGDDGLGGGAGGADADLWQPGEGEGEGEGEGGEGQGGGPGGMGGAGEAGSAEGEGEGEGEAGEGEAECVDVDGDDYGLGAGCLGRDCDDGDPEVHPGAREICDNGFDDDCDLAFDGADEDCASDCVDGDRDRYGQGPGCIAADCDDFDALVNPGVEEVCGDDVDNDCDGDVDQAAVCGADGDGAACWQVLDCLTECGGDAACAQTCDRTSSEAGRELVGEYADCVQGQCPVADEDPNCPYDQCGGELLDCLRDNDERLTCGELDLCLYLCGGDPPALANWFNGVGDACGDRCAADTRPAEAENLREMYTCFVTNCDPAAADAQDCFRRSCERQIDNCFGRQG